MEQTSPNHEPVTYKWSRAIHIYLNCDLLNKLAELLQAPFELTQNQPRSSVLTTLVVAFGGLYLRRGRSRKPFRLKSHGYLNSYSRCFWSYRIFWLGLIGWIRQKSPPAHVLHERTVIGSGSLCQLIFWATPLWRPGTFVVRLIFFII